MRILVVIFAILSFCLQGCTSMQSISGEPVNAESLIYQITGNELAGASYIVGTVPLQDSMFFAYPQKMYHYLENTDVFISFDEEQKASTTKNRSTAFADYETHYSVLSPAYFKSIATTQNKPVVSISKAFSIQELAQSSSNINRVDTAVFTQAFQSGLIEELVSARLQADVSTDQFSTLQSKSNYQIVDELITHMKLQPVFFPLDVVYLSGENGLLNLLRARGYAVKPMQEQFYKTNATTIQQRQLAKQSVQSAGNTNYTSTKAPVSGETKPATDYDMPEQPVALNLPIGLINLEKWGEYSLSDSLLLYKAPNRLKQVNELQELYSTTSNDLVYSIQIEQKLQSFDAAIKRIIITNGGQFVKAEKQQHYPFPALEVELIYAENQVSKHLVVQHPLHTIIANVKGPTPQIYSLESREFFAQLMLKQQEIASSQLPPSFQEGNPVDIPDQAPSLLWQVTTLNDLSLFLPKEPSRLDTLVNGVPLKGLVLPRGEVDNNLYLLTSTSVSSYDNFKLFNESINEAASELKAVIVNRTVMPSEKTYFASYILRDAIDNYYRVSYWYGNQQFYQFIIKGTKKSIGNDIATRIHNSITPSFTTVQPSIPLNGSN